MEIKKNKILTFSYDDGVTQDIRLVELFNKYGMKCTFNINSGLLGDENYLIREEKRVDLTAIFRGRAPCLQTNLCNQYFTYPSLKNNLITFLLNFLGLRPTIIDPATYAPHTIANITGKKMSGQYSS